MVLQLEVRDKSDHRSTLIKAPHGLQLLFTMFRSIIDFTNDVEKIKLILKICYLAALKIKVLKIP